LPLILRNAQFFENSKKEISHDSGGSLLGFVVAGLGPAFWRERAQELAVIVSLLIAGPVLIDAALTVIRRLRNRQSPFLGDRFHLYHLNFARLETTPNPCHILRANHCARGNWVDLHCACKFGRHSILSAAIGRGMVAIAVRAGALGSLGRFQDDSPSEDSRLWEAFYRSREEKS